MKDTIMANGPKNITLSLTSDLIEKLETLKKITGDDTTYTMRKALEVYYEKTMIDEEAKKIAKINALLDVQ